MGFELRQDAKRWFKAFDRDIKQKTIILFDLYYFCLIPGFITKRRNINIPSNEVDELFRDFPGVFRPRGELLVGLLINTELSRIGIDLKERTSVYSKISELVITSPPYLSNEGIKRMNEYAHGGFDVLCERMDERPQSLETFVRKYHRLIQVLQPDTLNY
ncbi:hypothetical protein [Myxosarcina sp. GI1]|uniref:hypothetical protein n=1 Tax=Myxosarcina sp. GI1 TaxID=1541065 RepID=UPI00055BBB96|nr:hypothetical protein [Myxosarcina sp. GI1]